MTAMPHYIWEAAAQVKPSMVRAGWPFLPLSAYS
jgi:hypothetical protein